jgi:hypothetical protein
MNKSRIRRVLSLLLIVMMLFSGNSITVLAGSDANTDTGKVGSSGGGSNPSSGAGSTINYYGGGYKIYYAIMDRHI